MTHMTGFVILLTLFLPQTNLLMPTVDYSDDPVMVFQKQMDQCVTTV